MASLVQRKKKNPQTGLEEAYWLITDRIEGKQVSRALGFISKKEAANFLAIYKGEVAKGEQPLKNSAAPSQTLSELWPRLTKRLQVEGVAASTQEQAAHCFKPLSKWLGDVPLVEIQGERLEDYVLDRREEGVRNRTIQIELRYLRQLLSLAVEEKLISKMPTFPSLNNDDSRPAVWLTTEQLGALVEALPWKSETSASLAIYLLINLGARRGEVLSRRWEDVRWHQGAHGTLWVGERIQDGETTWRPKTRVSRTIPLPQCVREVLLETWVNAGQPKAGWLCPSPHRKDKPISDLRKTLGRACKTAGLPVIHPHALRHSWATAQAMVGTPKPTTMLLGGWSDPRTLEKVYQHATDDSAIAAIELTAIPRSAPTGQVLQLNRKGA